MLNHGRTLLYNQDAGTRPRPDFPGEELIPATYKARTLPGALVRARRFLYGAAPDRLMLNYRTRQLTTMLHGTPELAGFMTDLDPRVTYWPRSGQDLFKGVFGETISQVQGPSTQLWLVGEAASGVAGQLQREWRIEVQAGSLVEIHQRQPIQQVTTHTYSLTNGLSSLVELPGSGFEFRFEDAAIGTAWLVHSNVRPSQDLGTIMANLRNAGEPLLLELFGIGTEVDGTEPWKTFRNLWNRHDQLPYALGGLVLALIYQINRLPPPRGTT